MYYDHNAYKSGEPGWVYNNWPVIALHPSTVEGNIDDIGKTILHECSHISGNTNDRVNIRDPKSAYALEHLTEVKYVKPKRLKCKSIHGEMRSILEEAGCCCKE